MVISCVVDVVPIAETGQQTACDILHGPKVHGKQDDDDHERGDEARLRPRADEVRDDGQRSKGHVEEDSDWMSSIEGSGESDVSCFPYEALPYLNRRAAAIDGSNASSTSSSFDNNCAIAEETNRVRTNQLVVKNQLCRACVLDESKNQPMRMSEQAWQSLTDLSLCSFGLVHVGVHQNTSQSAVVDGRSVKYPSIQNKTKHFPFFTSTLQVLAN